MHNAWLIARREYLERVRTRAFIVSTILIPVLMVGFVFTNHIMGERSKTAISHITLVSADTQFALDLQEQVQAVKAARIVVDVISPPAPDTRIILDHELEDKSLDGYLWITPATSPAGNPTSVYTSRSTGPSTTSAILNAAFGQVVIHRQLAQHGLRESDVNSMMQPVQIQQQRHAATSSTTIAYVLFFLMYMVVMLYGMNVARSIIEEKTSRVFEVLLSTIRPEEMMAGKIIGVGGVGLTQVFVWMFSAALLSATPLGARLAGGDLSLSLSVAQIFFFIAYFIFGFLVYSSIAAALGAMTNSEQELQQLNMILVMPLAFCMVMLSVVTTDPNSFWSVVVSLIPFCSPLLMNFRVSMSMPPAWQIELSFVLMSITIYALIWIASRIYRVGVLMYGKRPTLSELLRWLKYS
jgi:ABC-2 type transport system permease protein